MPRWKINGKLLKGPLKNIRKASNLTVMKKVFLFLVLFLTISTISAFAQEPGTEMEQMLQTAQEQLGAGGEGEATPKLITQLTVLAGLSVLPFAVMLLTSYVKVVIVLALLRNALGVQQSPPNQVLNGIALLVTLYVMFPTGLAMYNAAGDYIKENQPKVLFSGPTAVYMINVADKAKEPLRVFLQKNSVAKNINGFYQLAYKTFPESYRKTLKPNDFIILVPAFITSQLKTAFEIGVLIYLPFFVIDLVTSNILLAMGMMMLSPLTIALPLKLLLLVMVDGWTIIIQGLTMSFRM
jgi:type III secretion protein R